VKHHPFTSQIHQGIPFNWIKEPVTHLELSPPLSHEPGAAPSPHVHGQSRTGTPFNNSNLPPAVMLRSDDLQLPSAHCATRPNELGMPPSPMAVLNLGHLMRRFGFFVAVLFLAQLWCAWRIEIYAAPYLHWPRYSCEPCHELAQMYASMSGRKRTRAWL